MRIKLAHIGPGCPYCDHDHNPAIECRWKPESVRFQLAERTAPKRIEVHMIRDAQGALLAVRHVEV